MYQEPRVPITFIIFRINELKVKYIFSYYFEKKIEIKQIYSVSSIFITFGTNELKIKYIFPIYFIILKRVKKKIKQTA